MLILVPLCFLFGWLLPPGSMAVPFNTPPVQTDQDYPLDMAKDSVDDMYDGCRQEMMEKVHSDYFENEMQDEEFKDAWSGAASCARKKPREEDEALTKDHMQAICVYTGDDVYDMFNEAVRTQGPLYNTTFKFHSLHFLLTSAIQILNSNNHCQTTYRRTKHTCTGSVNDIVRFGTFASSSFLNDLTDFGNQTCFKIKTCLGAYVRHYSTYCDEEQEVLIPPYEKFKITEIATQPHKYEELKDCKVVYELESAGVESRLNCKTVNPRATSAASSRLQETLPSLSVLILITIAPHLSFTLDIFF